MRPTLQRTAQFQLAYTQGRKYLCPAFVLFHLQDPPDTRVAFVASKKVGGAVQRNRAKRVMRAALAEVLRDMPDAGPGWMVLVARREILMRKSPEIAQALRGILERESPDAQPA